MSIADWPAGERPREKLLQHGAGHLSDAELLAIFLRVGVAGKTAVDLAREMLSRFGGLQGVFNVSLQEFSDIKGLGVSKYCQLQSVLELAKRALVEQMSQGDTLATPQSVSEYLCMQIGQLSREQ